MKKISEMKSGNGTLLEESKEITHNIIAANNWEKFFCAELPNLDEKVRMAAINIYDIGVHNEMRPFEIRKLLDGLTIPFLKEEN